MKLLRYLVNTILFVVIWCIPAFIFVGISLSVSGTRPSGIAGAGGIIAIFISYALVKKINKSQLWANTFDFDSSETTRTIKELKKNKQTSDDNRYPIAVICSIIFAVASILGVYSSFSVGSYEQGLIFSIPLLLMIYWISQGYYKNDNKIKSSNIREEVVSKDKKDKSNNITEIADDLRELNKLKEDGILKEEEFNEQKKKLLKQ